MTDHLQPYPEYKDSGVEWLGEIPAHWDVKQLKYAVSKIVGGSTPSKENTEYWNGSIVWVTPEDISRNTHLFDSRSHITKLGLDSCSAMLVPAGSIVVTSRAPVGNVSLAEVELCTNQGCKAIVMNDDLLISKYVFYLMLCIKDELQRLSKGTTFTEISTTVFSNVRISVIPLDEQAAIVRYLDHADRLIRRYIAAKRKQIALLNEQKQAIIQQAVTRGLDPDVPLKPSGVEWVKEIPTNYKRTRLGHLCLSIRDGTHNPPPAILGIHRLLSVRNIIQGRFVIRDDDRTMSSEAFAELQRSYSVKKDDVVLALVGGTTGKSAVVDAMENVTVQRSIGIIRPDPELLDSRYLNFVLRSKVVQTQIKEIMDKYAAQPGIYLNDVSNLQIIFPDTEQQKRIVVFIEEKLSLLNPLGLNIEREIALAQEYRTRLIAEVVTGKLDVRGAVFEMPDEFDDPASYTGDAPDLDDDSEEPPEEFTDDAD
jgi:type I restriction enzyme, S subunit